MPTIIHATMPDGQAVDVPATEVVALTPNRFDADRTDLLLREECVSVDGRYEEWMERFAQSWPIAALSVSRAGRVVRDERPGFIAGGTGAVGGEGKAT